jgi:hypothetical protein
MSYGGSQGVAGVENILCSLILIDTTVETVSFSFEDMYIIGMGGSNYELWWIQRGGGCVIICAYY